jgi:ketosteroid isomerase-like protein
MEEPGPIDVITHLVTAVKACDLESAVALCEPGASFVIKPGFVVNGTRGLRQALEGFMALKPTLTIDSQQVVQTGDVAEYCARWNLSGIDLLGTAVQLGGRSPASCGGRQMGDSCSWWITPGVQILSRSGFV